MLPTTCPAIRPVRTRLAAAALVAALAGLPAAAAPADGPGGGPFAWLARAWTLILGASGGDSGVGMDPDGLGAPPPPPAPQDPEG